MVLAGMCNNVGCAHAPFPFVELRPYCNKTVLWLSLFCSDGGFLCLFQVCCLARPTKQQSCPEMSKFPGSLQGLWVNVMKAVKEGCAQGQLLVVLMSACHTCRVKGFCKSIQSTWKISKEFSVPHTSLIPVEGWGGGGWVQFNLLNIMWSIKTGFDLPWTKSCNPAAAFWCLWRYSFRFMHFFCQRMQICISLRGPQVGCWSTPLSTNSEQGRKGDAMGGIFFSSPWIKKVEGLSLWVFKYKEDKSFLLFIACAHCFGSCIPPTEHTGNLSPFTVGGKNKALRFFVPVPDWSDNLGFLYSSIIYFCSQKTKVVFFLFSAGMWTLLGRAE